MKRILVFLAIQLILLFAASAGPKAWADDDGEDRGEAEKRKVIYDIIHDDRSGSVDEHKEDRSPAVIEPECKREGDSCSGISDRCCPELSCPGGIAARCVPKR
jgi:hypothetical protein